MSAKKTLELAKTVRRTENEWTAAEWAAQKARDNARRALNKYLLAVNRMASHLEARDDD